MGIINLKSITKVYGKNDARVCALNKVDISIEKGELISIMGASGSGKSTLLNIIGCLDKSSSGKYYLYGHDVSAFNNSKLAKIRNSTFGFVVQNFALLNDYTVFENVEITLKYAHVKKKERKERIYKILEMLNLRDKINKYPGELSGGQNQRTAIARAIVNNPDIILADEPTGALDKNTGGQVMDIFKSINEEGKTIIIVTHDEIISQKCDRIIKISDGKVLD